MPGIKLFWQPDAILNAHGVQNFVHHWPEQADRTGFSLPIGLQVNMDEYEICYSSYSTPVWERQEG